MNSVLRPPGHSTDDTDRQRQQAHHGTHTRPSLTAASNIGPGWWLTFTCAGFLVALAGKAQPDLDSLRAVWQDRSRPDTVRLRALSDLAWQGYLFSQPESAHYYGQVMYEEAQRLGLVKQMAYALRGQGVAFKVRDDNAKALDLFLRSLELSRSVDDLAGVAGSLNNIGMLYQELGDLPRALAYHEESLQLREECGDMKGVAASWSNIGKVREEEGSLEQARAHFRRSLSIHEGLGFTQGMAYALSHLARVERKLQAPDSAMLLLHRSVDLFRRTNDRMGEATALNETGLLQLELGHPHHARSTCELALSIAEDLGNLLQQGRACDCLSRAHQALGDEGLALRYLARSDALEDSLHHTEVSIRLARAEFEKDREQACSMQDQEQRLAEAAYLSALQRKERARNIGFIGGSLAVLLAAGLWSRLRYIRRSNELLAREMARSDKLLLNILPAQIAKELKEKGVATPRNFEQVTILFTDFKEFTRISEQWRPWELVGELNQCFEAFDRICARHGIEKIKTIGDAYMAAGGLQGGTVEAARNTVLAGLEMQDFIAGHRRSREQAGEPSFEMRVGIHTGAVVAGIVGIRKFQYDLWGDTVNTAARLETAGEVGRVNISEATHDLVRGTPGLLFTPRGKVEVKGKGGMAMYFVGRG